MSYPILQCSEPPEHEANLPLVVDQTRYDSHGHQGIGGKQWSWCSQPSNLGCFPIELENTKRSASFSRVWQEEPLCGQCCPQTPRPGRSNQNRNLQSPVDGNHWLYNVGSPRWFMVNRTIDNGVYKPTHNYRAPHCTIIMDTYQWNYPHAMNYVTIIRIN